jgi:hypothetical protein
VARHVVARQGVAGPVQDGHGLRWQHGGPSGSPCRLHWWTGLGRAALSKAARGRAGPDMAWLGSPGHGLQTAARRAPALPAALLGGRGKAKQATVWQGAAGCGAVRPGGPWAADGSAEGFNPPRRPLGWTWQGAARSGPARSGGVRLGMPRRGRLRHGLTISALSPSGLSAGFFGIQIWLGMLRRAKARSGKAAQTPARHVPARVTDGGTEGSIPPCHPHKGGLGKAGLATARRGQVRYGLAGHGLAGAADGSTELLRRLPAALYRGQTGLARRG